MPSLQDLLVSIESKRDEMVEALSEIIRIPAIGPESGGEGEFERARFIKDMLENCGFDEVDMYDALDERVKLRLRPNIVAKKKGKSERTVWFVCHMDTVPPGDLAAWTYPPFSPRLIEGKLYGLGSEDNGQSLVAAISAMKAINDLKLNPDLSIGLALVADEEVGSEKGIKFLLDQGVFQPDDIVYVPDYGNADGTFIEVAEKHIMWLKVRVLGRQTHASTPEKGINAMKVGSELITFIVDYMESKYGVKNPLFDPPTSTYEPTKRLQTVGNVNTVPGEDIFFLDFRILPQYSTDDVMETLRWIGDLFEDKTGVKITYETAQLTKSGKPSAQDSEAYKALSMAIEHVKNVEPKAGGIGGGTCANFFRLAGIDAYCWETCDDMCHTANEYSIVDNLVSDTKVFATVIANLCHKSDFNL
jgi:succinyl-diaminopimelate desuccinylase